MAVGLVFNKHNDQLKQDAEVLMNEVGKCLPADIDAVLQTVPHEVWPEAQLGPVFARLAQQLPSVRVWFR